MRIPPIGHATATADQRDKLHFLHNLDPKQTYAALRKVDILLGVETTIRTSEVKNGAKMAAPNEARCDTETIQILNSALLRVTAQ